MEFRNINDLKMKTNNVVNAIPIIVENEATFSLCVNAGSPTTFQVGKCLYSLEKSKYCKMYCDCCSSIFSLRSFFPAPGNSMVSYAGDCNMILLWGKYWRHIILWVDNIRITLHLLAQGSNDGSWHLSRRHTSSNLTQKS